MKKLIVITIAGLLLFLGISFCNNQIKQAEEAHAEFVANVDYLKPEVIKYYVNGSSLITPAQDAKYDAEGNLIESSKGEVRNYWSYVLVLTPVSHEEAVAGYCAPNPNSLPDCKWVHYAMTAIASKDGQNYVNSYRWKSGYGFDPEAELARLGYRIEKAQYFVVSYQNMYNNPELNDIVKDIDNVLVPWMYAVQERDEIPVMK